MSKRKLEEGGILDYDEEVSHPPHKKTLPCNSFSKNLLPFHQDSCEVTYASSFLSVLEQKRLVDFFSRSSDQFKHETIYGVQTTRATASFGDEGLIYRYSGVTRIASPWSEELLEVREKLFSLTGTRYNYVLVNHYPKGDSVIGLHSDSEKDLVPNSPIASVSIGAYRSMEFVLKEDHKKKLDVILRSGSLLLMKGATQKYWLHRILRASLKDSINFNAPRWNLTFRLVINNK